jgi:Rtf2 RING-finger
VIDLIDCCYSMGGDGGTKAVHRSYLRGAGSASTTGDASRSATTIDPTTAQEDVARTMRFCALTDQPLNFKSSSGLVVCPYGRIYNKEAALEALIRRKQLTTAENDADTLLGKHIRGLKDLHNIRFLTNDDETPTLLCPVTGRELNGKIAAFALIPGTPGAVNVVSEYAMKQLSEASVFAEYIASDKIRLAPPPALLEEIKKQVAAQHAKEESEKEAKKKLKKARRLVDAEKASSPKKQRTADRT